MYKIVVVKVGRKLTKASQNIALELEKVINEQEKEGFDFVAFVPLLSAGFVYDYKILFKKK